MALVTLADYTDRYGAPGDAGIVTALLADASSLVQEVARQTIGLVAGDVATFEGDGSDLLCLPELPVVSIASIAVDGTVLVSTGYRLLGRGQVRRLYGCWTEDALIEVTYTHGYATVTAWIVGLVCSMVQRATRPEAVAGVQQQTTGSQSVAYASSRAGVTLWLTRGEAESIRGLVGPVVG